MNPDPSGSAPESPEPKGGGREIGWVAAAIGTTLPGDAFLYAVLPVVYLDLGLELWMVGVLLSANRFVRLLTNPIAGATMARFGSRAPFLIAVALAVPITASYGMAPGFAAFVFARAIWGLLWSFIRLGGFLSALAGSPEARGLGFGWLGAAGSLGTLVGVLLGGVLTDTLGFRAAAWIFATPPLVAALVLLRRGFAGTEHVPSRSSVESERPKRGDRRGRVALYALSFVNGSVGPGLVTSTLGLWLATRYGESVEVLGVVMGIASFNGLMLGLRFGIGMVGAPLAGHAGDRLGRLLTLGCAGIVVIACLVGLPATSSLSATVVVALLLFIGATAVRVSLDTIAGDFAARGAGSRVMSSYATASDLGSASGPLLGYLLLSLLELGEVYSLAAGLLGGLGLVGLLVLRRELAAGP